TRPSSSITSSRGGENNEVLEAAEREGAASGETRRAGKARRGATDADRAGRLRRHLRPRLGGRSVRRRGGLLPADGSGSVRLFRPLLVAGAGTRHAEQLPGLEQRRRLGAARLAPTRGSLPQAMICTRSPRLGILLGVVALTGFSAP